MPLPNLDDKTFAQLMDDAKKWIPRFAPEWTDHNAHDPGMTFIELFAWLAEMQHYYLDQILEEHELKYLRLLGAAPKEAAPARAFVTFSPAAPLENSIIVPRKTRLKAGEIAFETEEEVPVSSQKLQKIVSFTPSGMTDHTDASLLEGLMFDAFGSDAQAGSKLVLGFDRPFPEHGRVPLTFRLYDGYPVPKGEADPELRVTPSAEISWEYYSERDGGSWVPLEIVRDETMMLTESGQLLFRSPSDMKLHYIYPIEKACYWLRATVVKAGYELPPKITDILLHTVPAAQKITVTEETVGSSNGLPGQTFQLTRYPVVPDSLELLVEKEDAGIFERERWIRVETLDASGPNDLHYVLKADTGEILFGDGINGAVPPAAPPGQGNIVASVYEATSGSAGNVPARAISLDAEAAPELAQLRAVNLMPAVGGADKETLAEAKTRIRRESISCDRAVTSEDFERLTLSTPGLRVARAKAIPLIGSGSQPAKGSVTVVAVPYSEYPNPRPSEGFLSTICRHLNRHRLITTELHVVPPDYVKAEVTASIRVKPGYNPEAAVEKTVQALLTFLHPLKGGPEGTGWPFGRPVYVSEIYETIERVQGVDCVKDVAISAAGAGVSRDSKGNVIISPLALVYSDSHSIELLREETDCGGIGGRHGVYRA